LRGQRNPFVAQEGLPLMALVAALLVFVLRYTDPWLALLPLAALVLLFLLFRDPRRFVPPVALGIVSPVDGEIVEVDITNRCVVQGQAHRVRIRINPWGTYTARSPIEGRVMDLHSRAEGVGPDCPANAFWVETDEGDSVVLQFHDYRFGLPPKSFVRLGDRIGQGNRCAYIRLARFAELTLPIDGKVYVKVGQTVTAGTDVIGAVPHP
jgi:phosphatidylserine decarboxylase